MASVRSNEREPLQRLSMISRARPPPWCTDTNGQPANASLTLWLVEAIRLAQWTVRVRQCASDATCRRADACRLHRLDDLQDHGQHFSEGRADLSSAQNERLHAHPDRGAGRPAHALRPQSSRALDQPVHGVKASGHDIRMKATYSVRKTGSASVDGAAGPVSVFRGRVVLRTVARRWASSLVSPQISFRSPRKIAWLPSSDGTNLTTAFPPPSSVQVFIIRHQEMWQQLSLPHPSTSLTKSRSIDHTLDQGPVILVRAVHVDGEHERDPVSAPILDRDRLTGGGTGSLFWLAAKALAWPAQAAGIYIWRVAEGVGGRSD